MSHVPVCHAAVAYPRRADIPAMLRPLLVLSLFVLSACETVEGFGRDVQSGGEAIEEASEDAQ